jgi:hypothetical protein
MWVLMALISINHLFDITEKCNFSTFALGVIAWATILLTIIGVARYQLRQTFYIFFCFFCVNYALGPYLEPPADPLTHLQRSYSFIDKYSDDIAKNNNGLWHYSMSSVALPDFSKTQDPEAVFSRIDLLHGIYCGLLMAAIFLVSKATGLPDRWCLLSCVIAFIFFGTNSFSYFRYYSFGPSFTSLMIYFLWTAVFFFKRQIKQLLLGLFAALLCVPILITNHLQEAVFIAFIAVIMLSIVIGENLWRITTPRQRIAGCFILFGVLFIMPQFESVQTLIGHYSLVNDWEKNQAVVYYWKGIHIMGKIWDFRVNDTLGFMGIAPLFIGIFFLWPGIINAPAHVKVRALVLGILPLIIYCIPLFHLIWVTNCVNRATRVRYYYRICYSSMFWISITFFLFSIKYILFEKFNTIKSIKPGKSPRWSRHTCYFSICLFLLLAVGTVRSGPIYGKLDFLMLDSKPWWPEWKPLIANMNKTSTGKRIFTDTITSNVLHSVFNMAAVPTYRKKSHVKYRKLNVRTLDRPNTNKKFHAIINLQGFKPSWVPSETRHWSARAANTSNFYHYKGMSGRELKKILSARPPKTAIVLY